MRPLASLGAWRFVLRLADQAEATARPLCIDSAALVDVAARHEPTTSLLAPLLHDPDVPAVVSTIALAELVTRPARSRDHARVDAILAALGGLPGLTIIDFDQQHAIETAYVRAQTGLKLPDAAIVATARLVDASALIGNDRQWRNKPVRRAKSDVFPPLLARVVEEMTAASSTSEPRVIDVAS